MENVSSTSSEISVDQAALRLSETLDEDEFKKPNKALFVILALDEFKAAHAKNKQQNELKN